MQDSGKYFRRYQQVYFAEVPVYSAAPASLRTAAVIRAGRLEIELCSGADVVTIREII